MNIFLKKFEMRWSDLDANRHVANSAYFNLMSHTRMAYLMDHGFSHQKMEELHLGLIIFHELIQYFREVLPGQTVFVTLQLKGLSQDGMFFEFEHNIYSVDGTHHVNATLMGGFIDLQSRKLSTLPKELISRVFDDLERTEDFRWLTKADTRKQRSRPVNRPEWFTQNQI